jgi:hypothetical protein
MVLSEQQIKELMKTPRNKEALTAGGTLQSKHKLHITGENYKKEIKQVEGYEDGDEYNIRTQIAQPATIPISAIILDNLNRWTTAQGTVKKVEFGDQDKEKDFMDVLNQVWRGDSMEKFIQTFYKDGIYQEFNGFALVTKPKIVDENTMLRDGVVMDKPEGSLDPYIIFIANEDVHDFYLTGDTVEYIIIKLGPDEKGKELYRLIDDEKDIVYTWDKKDVRIESEIENEAGYVPARKLSGIDKSLLSSQVKTSPIDHIIPSMDRYFSSDTDLRMQFIRHNYPKLAIVSKDCDACNTQGYELKYDDNGKETKITCKICAGTGKVIPISRGGVIALPQYLSQNDTAYPGTPASYITPDTESLSLGIEDLKTQRKDIVYSATGDKNLVAESLNTATENVINSRSLEDRIRDITMMVEDFEEFIVTAIKDLHNDYRDIKEYKITIRYGKRISIKSEDELLNEIESAKKAGMPASFVTSLQRDLIFAKYKNNNSELQRQLLLAEVEPLSGYTVDDLKEMEEHIFERDMTVKVNFDSIISEIEANTPVALETEYGEKVEALNLKIDEILQGRKQRDSDNGGNVASTDNPSAGDSGDGGDD